MRAEHVNAERERLEKNTCIVNLFSMETLGCVNLFLLLFPFFRLYPMPAKTRMLLRSIYSALKTKCFSALSYPLQILLHLSEMVRSCLALAVQMTARWIRIMLHCLKARRPWVLSLTYLMPESKLIWKWTEIFIYWQNFYWSKSVFYVPDFIFTFVLNAYVPRSFLCPYFQSPATQAIQPWTLFHCMCSR